MQQERAVVLRSVVVFALAYAVSACGGAAAGHPASLEQDGLAADLEERAAGMEAELQRLEGKAREKSPAQQPGPPPPPADEPNAAGAAPKPAPEEPPAFSAPAPQASGGEPADEERPPARERCKTACRAFESMKRTSERICSLAGEGHEKCKWARSQVETARERIDRAGCKCADG